MSTTHYDIPFDIQREIIKRILDVKSLIRFRSVSKPWKSLIDSSKFISAYKSPNHRLLLTYNKPDIGDGYGYVSVADNDSFSQHNIPLPNSSGGELVCISQGLLCFYNRRYEQQLYHHSIRKSVKYEFVIWNPSIRKSVTFDVPKLEYFGFGVCPRTSDPKLVNIKHIYDSSTHRHIFTLAEIFTLSSRVWRSRSINLPNISNTRFFSIRDVRDHQAVIDGILYLHVATKNDNGMYNRIITFDLTSEEFGEVCLLDELAPRLYQNEQFFEYLSISKLNESLVVLKRDGVYQPSVWIIWIMEHGASKLFKKLYTIEAPFTFSINGFRMNGEAIIETKRKKKGILQVYDPCTGNIDHRDLMFDHRLSFMCSYTETLLLLNQ